MASQKRVLICGGGIAGTVLALFLKKAGVDCCVYETGGAEQGGVGLGLAPNGMRVLAALDVEERVRAVSVEATTFAFYNDSGRKLSEVPMWNAERCGLPGVTISRASLLSVLLEEMRRLGVVYRTGKRLIAIEQREDGIVAATFQDGSSAEGDLLVGADGIRSTVRRLAMPDAPRPSYTGLAGCGGFSTKVQAETAALNMIMGRNGFFGYANVMTAEGLKTMWWNTAEEPLPDRAVESRRTQEEQISRLLEQHAGWAEPVPSLIGGTEQMMQVAIHDVPALEKWSTGRVVLIGDAAHAVAPHSGQGASMAMEDAMMLAKLLRDRGWNELGATLKEFESVRRPRTERVVAMGRKNGARKHEMPSVAYWALQQFLRWGMPLVLRRQDWLLRYEVQW